MKKGLARILVLPEQDIKTADWSDEVAPFWGAVIKSAMSGKGLQGLFKAGWSTIKVSTFRVRSECVCLRL